MGLLLQILEVTTIVSHTGNQSSAWWSLPPPCWCVLVAALPTWSAKWLATHQSSWASAGVYGTFLALPPDVIVQWVHIWRVWWPTILFNEPRTVCLQTLRRDTCRVSWSDILIEDERTICVAAWWSLLASAVRVNFQVQILISAPKKPALFSSTHILLEKTSAMLKSSN